VISFIILLSKFYKGIFITFYEIENGGNNLKLASKYKSNAKIVKYNYSFILYVMFLG